MFQDISESLEKLEIISILYSKKSVRSFLTVFEAQKPHILNT